MIMLKIGIILDESGSDCDEFSEIGEYLAEDVFRTIYTGDNYIDVKYLGAEKVENS